jgi:hypothetical protein
MAESTRVINFRKRSFQSLVAGSSTFIAKFTFYLFRKINYLKCTIFRFRTENIFLRNESAELNKTTHIYLSVFVHFLYGCTFLSIAYSRNLLCACEVHVTACWTHIHNTTNIQMGGTYLCARLQC